jgi:hypothetical protein
MIKFALLLLVIASCGQDFNNSSFDESKFSVAEIDRSTPKAERFFQAYQLLDARCTSCHDDHDEFANWITSEDWVATNYVIPGNFEGSQLVQRLQFSGSNMPLNSSALNASEIETLRNWIEGLTP